MYHLRDIGIGRIKGLKRFCAYGHPFFQSAPQHGGHGSGVHGLSAFCQGLTARNRHSRIQLGNADGFCIFDLRTS